MKRNMIAAIADMYHLSMHEEFTIANLDAYKFKFTNNGLEKIKADDNGKGIWILAGEELNHIVNGKWSIQKAPFIPKTGESYAFIAFDKEIVEKVYTNDFADKLNILTNNIFKNKESVSDDDIEQYIKHVDAIARKKRG